MTMWSFISDWIFSCIKKTISSKLLNSLRCNFLLFSSVCVFSALFSSINKKNDDKKSHLHMKTEFLNSFSFSVLHSRTLRHSRDDKRQKQRLLFCRDATLYSDLMHQHVILKCKGWWRSLLLTPPTPDQHLSHLHLWRKVIQLRRVSSLFVSGNLMCLFDRFYKLKLSEVEQKLNFKLLCEHAVQPFSRWWRSSLWAQTEGDSVFVQADELQGPVSDTLIWFSLNGLVESTPASRRVHVTASRVGTRWVFVGSEVFFSAAAALSFSPDVNCSHSASWWFCLRADERLVLVLVLISEWRLSRWHRDAVVRWCN